MENLKKHWPYLVAALAGLIGLILLLKSSAKPGTVVNTGPNPHDVLAADTARAQISAQSAEQIAQADAGVINTYLNTRAQVLENASNNATAVRVSADHVDAQTRAASISAGASTTIAEVTAAAGLLTHILPWG